MRYLLISTSKALIKLLHSPFKAQHPPSDHNPHRSVDALEGTRSSLTDRTRHFLVVVMGKYRLQLWCTAYYTTAWTDIVSG
ncbi:Uncharacterized protein TCM_024178 [Theobroma cacao]|uniref:Uncharacterized protein n=1 Tax=Theobroma cacao TaxID=3641 RepID=A0A061EWV1_THECC|nr:Uncharacterized protein TCM_024178 [Theobroma cacao]